MRRCSTVAFLVGAAVIATEPAGRAQPDLPPPPPPPIGQTDLAPPPPVPTSPAQPAPPPPRRAVAPPPPPAEPPRFVRRRRPEVPYVVVVEEEPSRPWALTANPVALTFGRLSLNAELLLAPHHALIASPNVLLIPLDRGGRFNLVSEGAGFATHDSFGLGAELGYHYWPHAGRQLRGAFVGPSLLLGGTTDATVGDPSHMQAYWGVALDVGWQEVLPSGFTMGIGAGIEVLHLADATPVVPRFLFQLGWSL